MSDVVQNKIVEPNSVSALNPGIPESILSPGIYYDLSSKQYDEIPAIRSTYLRRLMKCPAAALIEEEDSKALQFGRAFHTYALCGLDAFQKEYALAGHCRAILKSGERKNQECGNPGFWFDNSQWFCNRHEPGSYQLTGEIISTDDFADIETMSNSIHAHPSAQALMATGKPEVTVVWLDDETELLCKARIDWLPQEHDGIVIDLKTAATADEHAFNATVKTRGYALTAGMYIEGLTKVQKIKDSTYLYGFIVVEKEPPFRCEVYEATGWLEYGNALFHEALRLEKKCREANYYPAHKNPGVGMLVPPGYLNVD